MTTSPEKLEVDLERHGGTAKRGAKEWAKRSYKSTKDASSWTYRCSNPPASPRLGKDSYECRSEDHFEIGVRKDKDVLQLTLTGKIAANEAAVETMRAYADQILKGL
ncbi:hypothetical protein ACU686_12130 [Yinghuangia aomiensis]